MARSSPSTTIHPSVASTKRTKERARVLFPEPVRPRIPIWICLMNRDVIVIDLSHLFARLNFEIDVVQNVGEIRLATILVRGSDKVQR